MQSRHLVMLGIATCTMAAIALVFTLFPSTHFVSKAASTSATATASLLLIPNKADVAIGETLPIQIQFLTPNTPDDSGIIGIKALVSLIPAQAFTISTPTTSLGSPWTYIRHETTTTGNSTLVSVEAVYFQAGTTGYTAATSSPQTLAVVNLIPSSAGTIQATINTTSEIRTKKGNADILQVKSTQGVYTVGGDGTPSPRSSGFLAWIKLHLTPLLARLFAGRK